MHGHEGGVVAIRPRILGGGGAAFPHRIEPMTSLVYITLVLALGVLAQWLAWKFKLPSILLLLLFGFGLGHFTGVRVDDFLALHNGDGSPLLSVVGLFVAIILFEGGLTLRLAELKDGRVAVFRLCTVAVLVSAVLSTVFMGLVLGYEWRIAAVIGAILTVTGPTVIAPLLRDMNPSRKIASILRWEGIVVDPIGAILAVLVFKWAVAVNGEVARESVFFAFGILLLVGGLGGWILAKAIVWLLAGHRIPDYLQPVFLLSVVAVAFTAANAAEKEAGLLTVTVMGIVLGNQRRVSVKHILEFKENLGVLIISTLFIILSGRIALADLRAILPMAVPLLLFLIVVVRPLSVFLSMVFSKGTTVKDRIFLAALAPRGIVAAAVTAIFALEFETAASGGRFESELGGRIADQADDLVALVFLVIVGTVTFYGLLAGPLARYLGLASRGTGGILFAGADAWVRVVAKGLQDEGHSVVLLDTNYKNVAAAKLDGLNALRANILSEFAEEELDFNGLGTLIAATPNDEVNSMAATQLIDRFGRAGVWQIPPSDSDQHHTTTVADHMRGRICFTGKPRYEDLNRMVAEGAILKKTLITEKFTLSDFSATHRDEEPHILFLESDRDGLRPAVADLDHVAPETAIYTLVLDHKKSGGDPEASSMQADEV